MPSLAHGLPDDDLSVDSPTVCELMDRFYQAYVAMAGDPCLDDLAEDVAQLIIELDQRRDIAMLVAAEQDQDVPRKALH